MSSTVAYGTRACNRWLRHSDDQIGKSAFKAITSFYVSDWQNPFFSLETELLKFQPAAQKVSEGAIKNIRDIADDYRKSLAISNLNNESASSSFDKKISVRYEPLDEAVAEYISALKRYNGGTFRYLLVGARIPPTVAKNQLQAAVLGAIEALMIELQHKNGRVVSFTAKDEEHFQDLIAQRLGNLPRDKAALVSYSLLSAIRAKGSNTKIVVNGGAISVSSQKAFIALPKARLSVQELISLHLTKPPLTVKN